MCARYRLSRRKEVLAEHFSVDVDELDWEPRYNIAPTQPVPVIRRDAKKSSRMALLVRWGLIPSWAADPNIGTRTINARSETAASKPSFREPLQKRRCLVPADAFYEWRRTGKQKQPFCFEVGHGSIFAFAGLWDSWRGSDGTVIESCTILTTTANKLLEDIHDRMPVILARDQYDDWHDPELQNSADVVALLMPLDANLMKSYPVSTKVNSVSNDDPECCAPVHPPERSGLLFG